MGRHKKKKKQNNRKKQNKTTHANANNKNEIMNKLHQAQNRTSIQLNQANKHNKYGKQHNKKWKQKAGGHKSELKQFFDQLRPLGLGIRNASSDGNCLFRAISDQISGTERNHAKYRADIVQYMITHSDEFSPFYVGDYNKYLKKMGRNGIWGGNMELTAAAKAFKVDIVIHSLNAARYEILYQKGKPTRTIHLSYHNEKHYASVRRLDDMSSNSPSKDINLGHSHYEALQREKQRSEIAWCHNGGNPLDFIHDDVMHYMTHEEPLMAVNTPYYEIDDGKEELKQDMDDNTMNMDHKSNNDDIEMNTNIKCIHCDFEYKIIMFYLKHYNIVHVQKQSLKNEPTICICGQKNESHLKECAQCGWDLRYKPLIPKQAPPKSKPKSVPKPKPKPIVVHKESKPIETVSSIKSLDEKYKKYLRQYWICAKCSFWNCHTNKECMVCDMNTKKKKKKQNINKKRNEFGWICNQCTFENKPAHQNCKMCNDPKPKKGKQKKEKNENNHQNNNRNHSNNDDDDDNNDNGEETKDTNDNKWSVAGNNKCHCGSGKKYKKCCKKLERHYGTYQRIQRDDKRDHRNDNNVVDPDDILNVNELSDLIDKLEHDISNFKGKTNKYMMRELNKLKGQKNALSKTLGKAKAKKVQKDSKYTEQNGKSNSTNKVVNTTIAI